MPRAEAAMRAAVTVLGKGALNDVALQRFTIMDQRIARDFREGFSCGRLMNANLLRQMIEQKLRARCLLIPLAARCFPADGYCPAKDSSPALPGAQPNIKEVFVELGIEAGGQPAHQRSDVLHALAQRREVE